MKPNTIKLCLCCLKPKAISAKEDVCRDCLSMLDQELHEGVKEVVSLERAYLNGGQS